MGLVGHVFKYVKGSKFQYFYGKIVHQNTMLTNLLIYCIHSLWRHWNIFSNLRGLKIIKDSLRNSFWYNSIKEFFLIQFRAQRSPISRKNKNVVEDLFCECGIICRHDFLVVDSLNLRLFWIPNLSLCTPYISRAL